MSEEFDEIDLLAFRYVAGEMAAEEAAAFELRLADDHAARLAVSRAVELTQRLVEAAPSQSAAVARPQRHGLLTTAQSLGWMAIGAAAAVLAVNLVPRPATGPIVAPHPATAQPLGGGSPANALAWARLQSNQESTAEELERWLDQSVIFAEEADDWAVKPEVPSWVFAANRKVPQGAKP